MKLADGKEVKLDEPRFENVREAPTATSASASSTPSTGKWKEYERTFGVTFYSTPRRTRSTPIRKYPDSFARAMDGNNLPPRCTTRW